MACNIYIFQFFSKKTFLTMLGNILLWISNQKTRSCFEQSSGICFCSLMMMMLLLMIAWWSLVTFTFFNFFAKFFFDNVGIDISVNIKSKIQNDVLSKVREFDFEVGCRCWCWGWWSWLNASNIYIFQFFCKIFVWQCWETY